MWVAVCGSRNYPDRWAVEDFVDAIPAGWTLVTGGQRGVDKWAYERARSRGDLGVRVVLPEADAPDKSLELRRRTRRVVAMADYVRVFIYNYSPGSTYAAECAVELGKPLLVTHLPATT